MGAESNGGRDAPGEETQPEFLASALGVTLPVLRALASRFPNSEEVLADGVLNVIRGYKRGSFNANYERRAPLDAFRAWACEIVRNVGRKRARPGWLQPTFVEVESTQFVAGGDGPLETAIRAERHAWVHRLLEELPEDDRTLLHLLHFEDLEPTEIAAHLRRSPGTVRSKISRLRAKLRFRFPGMAA